MNFLDIFSKNEQRTSDKTMKITSSLKKDIEAARAKGKKIFFNLIVLDESGSMISIYQQAINGVNQTLKTVRDAEDNDPEQVHFTTLVTFNSQHYNCIYNCATSKELIDITEQQYRPGACTPLYDAMGRSINELSHIVTDDDIALVTIITDGEENASHKYNVRDIKELVDLLREKGWTFAYIGANQDVERVASSLAIDNYNTFEANEESTQMMFEREAGLRNRFYYEAKNMHIENRKSRRYFDEPNENK